MSTQKFVMGAAAVAAGAGLWMAAQPAQATVITKNGSTTIVSDTYEAPDTPGSPVSADSGSWDASNGNYLFYQREIADVTNAGSPGAYSGTQYAVVGAALGNGHLTASTSLANGNTLKFDSMVYYPSISAGVDYPFQFMVIGAPAIDGNTLLLANRLLDFYRLANGNWGVSGGAQNIAGPATFAADTWQHWVLDYTVGAANATLTIDGASIQIPATNTTLQGSNGIIAIASNYSTAETTRPIYLDSVPEPASLSLVALGGLAMIRRRAVGK